MMAKMLLFLQRDSLEITPDKPFIICHLGADKANAAGRLSVH
jgi:hypothetical protein